MHLGIRIAPAALVLAVALAQQSLVEPQIFRPAPDSILAAGPLSIVARGSAAASVLLDGQPVKVLRPGPTAISAVVNPPAGRHELTLRDGAVTKSASFFVRAPAGSEQAPAEWKEFVEHPPKAAKAACETCHGVKDAAWSFRGDSLRSNCFGCHQQQSFAKVHSHEPPVIPDCQMCHSPHGSTEAKHMKLPRKAACEQCHPL